MNRAARISVSSFTLCLLLALFPLTAPTVARAASDGAAAPALREWVTVTTTRLPDETPLDRVPAHVTVILREQIARSGARTLQDLLVREAGFVVHDQIGNDLQTTIDLRGTGGSGTRVFLDGAPINDPRNNALALELIPVSSLERVEIVRGSGASQAGGGAQAGAIHLTTRRGGGDDALTGAVTASAGSFDTTRVAGEIGGGSERLDFFLNATTEDSDGFRTNAGGDTTRLAGTLGTDVGGGRRLQLAVLGSRLDSGNPGALTAGEFAADPERAPFNRLDFTDQRQGQLALGFKGPLAGAWSIAANVFHRNRQTESLTTGRSAPAFGGFFLDAQESSIGSTVQVSRGALSGAGTHHFSVGVEWLDSDTDAAGIATLPGALGTVDAANLSSDNTTERRTTAIFLQDTWRLADRLSLVVGLRGDRDRVGYVERFPGAGNEGARTFSEVSLRAGTNWNPSARVGLYASYGEAYLPPTVEQMYSFPTFGSNRALEPEDSQTLELGLRLHGGPGSAVDVAVFRIDKDNEIVFDPSSPLGSYGANVNAGRTRRDGVEATVRGRVSDDLGLYTSLTLIDSQFRGGADAGRSVPLVPDVQVTAGLDADLSDALTVAVDARYVGKQVLDNDSAATQPRLGDYAVFNARVAWRTPLGRSRDEIEVFVEGRNLFDTTYATRGIYAFDFSSFVNETFLTPAPGRSYQVGARYGF